MSNAVEITESPKINGQILVEARGLSKTYHDGTRELEVLRGADLTVRKGEIISIVGASGAGKSTLLHLLGALDKPNAGTIKLDGNDLGTMDSKSLAALRARSIGFIFQFHHLHSDYTRTKPNARGKYYANEVSAPAKGRYS